jgi:hypothetical protein
MKSEPSVSQPLSTAGPRLAIERLQAAVLAAMRRRAVRERGAPSVLLRELHLNGRSKR